MSNKWGAVQIGWVLNRAYWGQGIADEITKALIQHAKTTAKSCVIECDERQEISRHIALKNGFEYVGTDNGISVYRLELPK